MTSEERDYVADIDAELMREWNEGRYALVISKRTNFLLIPLRVWPKHWLRQFTRWVLKVTTEKRDV